MESVTLCLPLIGAVRSAGSLRWFTQLAMRAAHLDTDMRCANVCVQLLRDIAAIMRDLANPYHLILRSRWIIWIFDCRFRLIKLIFAACYAGYWPKEQRGTKLTKIAEFQRTFVRNCLYVHITSLFFKRHSLTSVPIREFQLKHLTHCPHWALPNRLHSKDLRTLAEHEKRPTNARICLS